jgi:outer membrane protein
VFLYICAPMNRSLNNRLCFPINTCPDKMNMISRMIALAFVLFVLFIVPSSVSGQGGQKWSLQQCIDFALQNNIAVKQSELSLEMSDASLDQSRAALFPSINGSGSYSYNFGRSVDIFSYEFTTREIRSANISLSGNLSVFNGFQLMNSLAQSRYEFYAGRENLQKIKNDIALNVATAFLQVLYSQETLKNAEERLSVSTKSRERARIMVEAGSLSQGNLLDADAALASDELAVISARNLLATSKLVLIQLLELKSAEGFEVTDPSVNVPDQNALSLSPDDIYAISAKTLPEFRAAEYNIQSAEKGLSIARGARYPQLNLFGSINSGYSSASRRITGEKVSFDDQLDENFNKSLGLSLNIPIFNGWSAHTNIRRSKIGLENAMLSEQLTRNQVYKSIVQAHSDAVAALQKYQAADKARSSANLAFTYAEKRYDLGLMSSLDFINVQNARSKANSDFLQAKYDLIFRIKVIDFYLGRPLSF